MVVQGKGKKGLPKIAFKKVPSGPGSMSMQGFEQRIKRLQSAFQDFCKKTAEESKGSLPEKKEKRAQPKQKPHYYTTDGVVEEVDLECKEIIEAIPSARSQVSALDFADSSSQRLTEQEIPFQAETDNSAEP